ncbi:MAG TPA: J domain-containing protein, partial [Lacipirellulaceae bacterium]|nr:J domain-containing protein [Lacipirellulaceae bacterium]
MMTRAQACNVLNVEAEASAEAVKHAYRRAALRWHPDRCDEPDAARRFTEVHAAYEWLMATPDATPGARDERRGTPS